MKNILLASTSTVYGSIYLEYLLDELKLFFAHIDEILFVPYARPSGITYNDYTAVAANAFSKIGKRVIGIHTFENPQKAVKEAKAIFVGGGNTFVLTNELYKKDLITLLKHTVLEGVPYFGTSAGSNICGLTIKTTNDMPVVYPPSFNALGLVSFNINPHYIDPDENSRHMGETRETRIKEFHYFNTQPVVGLREGSWLDIKGDEILLKGVNAKVFEYNKAAYNIEIESRLNNLN